MLHVPEISAEKVLGFAVKRMFEFPLMACRDHAKPELCLKYQSDLWNKTDNPFR